jgi:DNA-binding transcriptional ArsR family regulator
MTRRISADAYHRIEAEGLLSKRRFQVYSLLYHHGPLTIAEACAQLATTVSERSFSPRFAELRDLGVVDEVGERQCRVTGNNVIAWDVNEKLPRRADSIPKEPTKVELLRACCKLIDRAVKGTALPVTKAKQWEKWREDATHTLQACAKHRGMKP